VSLRVGRVGLMEDDVGLNNPVRNQGKLQFRHDVTKESEMKTANDAVVTTEGLAAAGPEWGQKRGG